MSETISVERYARPRVHGRFLFLGEDKFFVRGVTYGPFPKNSLGDDLPEPAQVEADFAAMREAGINTARIYYVPPKWFLEAAERNGVYLMVGIPWPQHICFLDQWEVKEEIKKIIRDAVAACKGYNSVLAYAIGNEIPAHIVRWHGAQKIERFLRDLVAIVREEDPKALVTYANYPSTEYLRLNFLDFVCFNVYLHDEKSFRAYVKKLQNVAGDIPLVLSEFGMDSMRNGVEHQAETLAWQVKAAFELGVSGTFVFAWTDEWFTGGNLIEDWAFGLVDAERQPKPALAAVSQAYRESLPVLATETPRISVVVCAYNAEPTMGGCLASFLQVKYPNFEVVIVDDGSTDSTGAIADRYASSYPDIFKVIHQPNKGLSVARNVGMFASTGDIVAYTDSDCYVDPHWLDYMALAFRDERFVAVGGPNLPPPEDNRVAACVAVSPGAPTHVLVTDELAEHIPGCNMAFRKWALMEIEGFDATYRAAGDDVDVCWRLQDKGYDIGFSAAMMVWHHRRNTVSAYLKQQKGYGRAEALLYPKHPDRFNALGNSRWAGRIYGDISGHLLTARPVVYHGVFGSGLFQTLYEPQASLANYLPLSFEWIMAGVLMTCFGLLSAPFALIGLGLLGASLAWAGHRAMFARLPKAYDDWRSRLLITVLTLSQPVLRGWTRYRTLYGMNAAARKAQGKAENGAAREVGSRCTSFGRVCDGMRMLTHHFSFHRFFWNHEGVEREEILDRLLDTLAKLKLTPKIDNGFASPDGTPPWDVEINPGMWTRAQLRVTVENHGGNKRFVRLAGAVKPTGMAAASILGTAFIAGAAFLLDTALMHMPAVALTVLALPVLALGLVIADHFRAATLVSIITQHLSFRRRGDNTLEAPMANPAQATVQAPAATPELRVAA